MINKAEALLAPNEILLPETRALRDQRVAFIEAELALYRARREKFFDVGKGGAREVAANGFEDAYRDLQIAALMQEKACHRMQRPPLQFTPLTGEQIITMDGVEDEKQYKAGATHERTRMLALLGPEREQKAFFEACSVAGVNPCMP